MFKKFVVVSIILILFFTKTSYANENFISNADIIYQLTEEGLSEVSIDITIQNANDEYYSTSYTLQLNNVAPTNIKGYYKGSEIPFEVESINNNYSIKVDFDDVVVGKGSSRSFSIKFYDETFAEKTGEVWEISIPKIKGDNSFSDYKIKLIVPVGFGNEAYISPEVERTIKGKNYEYTFSKDILGNGGITAGFGKFQVFSFILNYHLENPLNKEANVEIALPPDTSVQKMYYENIEPKPENVSVDSDGNWLALFKLKSRERIDIIAHGSVKILSSPRKLIDPNDEILKDNLNSTEFWQSNNSRIVELSKIYKSPRQIYNYVVSTLNYDYERVKPNIQRLGAVEALVNKNSAICMEFTDLFIALSRAAGIPAREINGYAYTENPEIQPLSLVADVLHSWPEYWDKDNQVWVPVDPTWESTSGINYFDKLDLRHFTFVIHGKDPKSPYPPGSYKLGTNPQKDVFVSIGQLPVNTVKKLELISEKIAIIPFVSNKVHIIIANNSPSAIYNVNPKVLFDGEVAQETYFEVLPPYSKKEMQVIVPYSVFGTSIPNRLKIITRYAQLEIPTHKTRTITINVISFIGLLVTILVFVMHKTGRIKPVKLNIVIIYEKISKIAKKNKA